jgi:hypothetical protein
VIVGASSATTSGAKIATLYRIHGVYQSPLSTNNLRTTPLTEQIPLERSFQVKPQRYSPASVLKTALLWK